MADHEFVGYVENLERKRTNEQLAAKLREEWRETTVAGAFFVAVEKIGLAEHFKALADTFEEGKAFRAIDLVLKIGVSVRLDHTAMTPLLHCTDTHNRNYSDDNGLRRILLCTRSYRSERLGKGNSDREGNCDCRESHGTKRSQRRCSGGVVRCCWPGRASKRSDQEEAVDDET